MPPTISEALIEAYLESLQIIHIDTLPSDQKMCPVCQDPYLSRPLLEHPVRINSLHLNSTCRHIFGRRCIEMHIRVGEPWSVRCPICREDWFTVHDGGATATVALPSPVVPRQVDVRPPLRPAPPRLVTPRPVDSEMDNNNNADSNNEGSDSEGFYFEEFDGGNSDDWDDEDYDDEDRRRRVSRGRRLIRYMGFIDRILGQLDRVGRANPDDELARLLADLGAEFERR